MSQHDQIIVDLPMTRHLHQTAKDLARAESKVDKARARRNKAIISRIAAGRSRRHVALEFGVSPTAVQKIWGNS